MKKVTLVLLAMAFILDGCVYRLRKHDNGLHLGQKKSHHDNSGKHEGPK